MGCKVVNRSEVRKNTPLVVEKCTLQSTHCLQGFASQVFNACCLSRSLVGNQCWIIGFLRLEDWRTVAVKEETGERGEGTTEVMLVFESGKLAAAGLL